MFINDLYKKMMRTIFKIRNKSIYILMAIFSKAKWLYTKRQNAKNAECS